MLGLVRGLLPGAPTPSQSAVAVAPKITQASVKRVGFITDGVSFPLPPSLGRSTTVTVQNTGGLNATISQVTVTGKGFTGLVRQRYGARTRSSARAFEWSLKMLIRSVKRET